MQQKKRVELVETISKLVGLLSDEEKQSVFGNAFQEKDQLPISIFRSELSGLEAITVYLKDYQNESIPNIAKTLNRNQSTIYTTYYKAKKKKFNLDISDLSTIIPLKIFSNRKFSILESIISYLKEKGFKLIEIAKLIDKKYSTIATTYQRYKEKCK